MLEQIRALVDESSKGYLVALVNVSKSKRHLLCGFAAFRGGLTGDLIVCDVDNPKQKFSVKVPESVREVATSQIFSSPDDSYEVELNAIET